MVFIEFGNILDSFREETDNTAALAAPEAEDVLEVRRPFMKVLDNLKWNAPSGCFEEEGVNVSSEMLKNIREEKRGELIQAAYAADCEASWEASEHREGGSDVGTQGHTCPEGTWWSRFVDRLSSSWESLQGHHEALVCEETLAEWHGTPAGLGTLWADQVIEKVAKGPKLRGELMLVFLFLLFR